MNKLYAIGLGPGDPELITLKAIKILKNVDKVIVPESNLKGRSLANDIIIDYVDKYKIEMFYFPMNNNKILLDKKYNELVKKIINIMNNNKTIAYVTIGDSTIYSTFNYLWLRLRKYNIEVEFIPGIPSFIAVSNILQIPLTLKNENLCLIEMPENQDILLQYIKYFNTIIIMKIYKRIEILLDFIKANKGLIEEAFMVEKATLKDQNIVKLMQCDKMLCKHTYLSTAIIKTRDNGKARGYREFKL